MKKMMVIITFVSFTLGLHSQTESRFPIKSTSEWRINFNEITVNPTWIGGEEEFKLFIENDTLIDTQTYYKLYKSGIAHYDTLFTFDHVYVGAIRDEENKFLFIEKNSTKEEILYDFGLSEGDTIYSEVEQNMVITSVEILKDERKKINILKTDFQHGECSNVFNTYLIEGIGSMGGLFYESPCNHVGFLEHYLVCYCENDSLIYQSSQSPYSCNLSINYDKPVKPLEINVFPIPASKSVTISLPVTPQTKLILNLYDTMGAMISFYVIEPNNDLIELNLDKFGRGLYFIKVYYNNKSFTSKIILE